MEKTETALALADALTEINSPSATEVAAFIDGTLAGEDRERLEAYFADHPLARRELVHASRIVSTLPAVRSRNTRWAQVSGLIAAAAVAVVLLRPGALPPEPVQSSSRQRGVIEESQSVTVVAPGAELTMAVADRAFVWRSIDGATYRLIVLDGDGRTILRQSTSDTTVSVPSKLAESAGTYYWSVDAQAPDGSSVTSGVREFTITSRK